MKFKLNEFLDIGNLGGNEISFDWALYHKNLAHYIQKLATFRYKKMLQGRERQTSTSDLGYQPSSSPSSSV